MAVIDSDRQANKSHVIANSTGSGYVFQERLADLPMGGNGDGTMDDIVRLEIISSNDNAKVTLAGLDAGRKSAIDFAEIERNTDDDDELETVVFEDKWTAGVVNVTDYDSFVADHDPVLERPALDPDRPAVLCHTSGTTGRPKGVTHTHRHLWSHTMAVMTPMGLDIGHDEVVMPLVPMFHVNAWGLPHAATAAGAKQVYPGPSPDPADVVGLIEREGVTLTAGVPSVWLDVLGYLAGHDADLSTLERIVVGGAAPPERLLAGFDDRGVEVVHGWGMTETAPVGAVSHPKPDTDADGTEKRAKQGLALPGLEFDVVDDEGRPVPWDGETFGELRVRGPWVADGYVDAQNDAFEGPWLRTGDVVTVDRDGYIEMVDRVVDVVKSGGEWIPSQRLESAIRDHGTVSEAAVVGVDHERWGERPVAVVVADADDPDAVRNEIAASIRESFPDWWLPDRFEFVDSLPRTATDKVDKRDLRERYGNTTSTTQ
jgi:fatty-acyl-CoA synthase